MRWYLDASVALHATLPGGDGRARDWLDAARRAGDGLLVNRTLTTQE